MSQWLEALRQRRARLGLAVYTPVPVVPVERVRPAPKVAKKKVRLPPKPDPMLMQRAELREVLWREMEVVVAERHGLPRDFLRNRLATKEFVAGRAEFYYLMRTGGWSYPRIGAKVGRDHTTIIHNVVRYADKHNLPVPTIS